MARTTSEIDEFPRSPYARELQQSRRRFEADIEREFAAAHVRRTRGRVRAWHCIVLAMLGLVIVPQLLALRSSGGVDPALDAWNPADDLLLWVLVLCTAARAMLVAIAWSPWYERLYPKLGLPLVAASHGLWAFACSGEMLGPHPEYLAALITDAFAAYFFSGLLFRRGLLVCLTALAGLLLGGWHHTGELAPIMYFAVHLAINVGIAAAAGYAHERSERNLFLEHSMLEEMAARDGLTGLKNRRALDEHLAHVWQQALRDRKMLAVLMIDVDAFKDYNDSYGHQAGDKALKRLARAVDQLARRPLDIAARYGGEELVLVLHDLPREHVVEMAEKVRHVVRALAIEHRRSARGIVTVSIGVGIVQPAPHRSPAGALQLADQALYRAKEQGRDRTVVLEQEYESLTTGVFQQAHGPSLELERTAAS